MADWFVVNVADSPAMRHERGGSVVRFESPDAAFPDLGINIRVLEPGQPNGLGARDPDATLRYPVSELAAEHGASVSSETSEAREAYADAGWEPVFTPVELDWPPRAD